MNRRVPRLGICFFLIFSAYHACGQFAQRGALSGTVFDALGSAVPEAQLTLLDIAESRTRTVKTDTIGHFEFDDLTAGQYQLTAAHEGFQTEKSEAITVNIGATAHYDFKLHPGSVKESVVVTAEAAGLETDQMDVDTNISAKQVEELPMNGRNFTSLAALAPGVSTTPQLNINPTGTYAAGAMFAMGGTAFTTGGSFEGSRDNGFYMNGVNITENYESTISYAPSAEAITTATIQVADFSAANGHDISTLGIQTKGGTNKFHGEAYDFLENTDLNAVNPYVNAVQIITQTPSVKPTLQRNQFGGGVGGPVYRNKVFFFANFEDHIEHNGSQPEYLSVPSAAERNGDFSELLASRGNLNPVQLYNPFSTTYDASGNSTRTPVPGNILTGLTHPAGPWGPSGPLVDPAAAKLLQIWPLPNIPNANGPGFNPSNESNYYALETLGFHVYHIDSRFDAVLSSKDSVFVTWSRSVGDNTNSGGIPPAQLYIQNVDDRANLVTVNYAHVFNPRLTNEFIFGMGHGATVTQPPGELSYLNSRSNPFNSLFQNTGPGVTRGVLAVNVPGYASPGFGEIFRAENKTFQISDNLDWIHGRQTLAAGMNYFRKGEYDWDFIRYVNFASPAFSAGGFDQGYVGGDSMADLLMGIPADIHQRFNFVGGDATAPEANEAFPYWGFYINDKVRINPKLTLSLGLRYDLDIPLFAYNNLCCAIYVPNATGGVLKIPGIAPGVPQHYLSAPKKDFAPRVGVTYSPTPAWVVRAGYGIFFNAGATQISTALGNALTGTPGYFSGNDLNNVSEGYPSDTPALNLGQIFQAAPNLHPGEFPVSSGPGEGNFGAGEYSTIIYSDQKSTPLPYYQRYLLDVQHQIKAHDIVTVSLVGNQGRKGSNETNINLAPYATGWPTANAYDAARPNNAGYFGDIYVMRPTLNSFYNAGIAQYRHDFSRGFQFLSNYTFGKTVSDYPYANNVSGGAVLGGYGSGFQYPNIRDRGESTLSHRHRFVYSGIWTPQYGKSWPGWAKITLADWRISGIGTLESGNALTVTNGGPANCLANGVCGSSADDYAGFDELYVSGNPNLSHGEKSFSRQFDTSKFSLPPQNVRGNSGLGTIRGPGQNNLDLSVAKTFPLYERVRLEFRADAFNAWNHTQWNGVNTTYPSGNAQFPFGQVSGAREARIGQLAARVVF